MMNEALDGCMEEQQQAQMVVEVTKELKAKSDTLKGPNEDHGNDRPGTIDAMDWSVLRAQMETLCGDLLGGAKRDTRFRRKYQRVVMSDQTLVEILGDDHLGGKAKSVFLSLPVEVRERGFEMVVQELGKLLAEDSVAGRMRAIAELRELRIRPHQDVADFCVALEKLGRKANPHATIEDSSLDFAHILLSNLKDWPEHVQLLSALHRTKPEKAYEEVKQLALSIELSKRMYTGRQEEKRGGFRDWKARVTSYNSNHAQWSRSRPVTERESMERGKGSDEEGAKGPGAGFASRTSERRSSPNGRRLLEKSDDSRKCFKCSRFGHIAKECTQRTHVNRINETQVNRENLEEDGISSIIQKARSMGVRTARSPNTSTRLIGRRISGWVSMLETRVPALLDTGSMISIIPIGVLARAKDRGFDVDKLKLIKNGNSIPVYDASNNKMEFLGAVEIEVELEGGRRSDVAFYVADSGDDEILLGTNSLSDLGVNVRISQSESDTRKGKSVGPKSVTVAKRIYIPPHGARVVSAHSNVGEQTAEGVVWPTKEGLGCGVFKVRNQKLGVPVVNSSDKPMVLGKGEEIGQWGTEKWKEKWEEFNPCITEDTVKARTKEPRRALLVEQTRRSSNVSEVSDDIMAPAESHERIQEYNRRVRNQMKVEYDRRHKVNAEKHAKVGDRVYLLVPKEKAANSHPKLTPEWTGPFRVLESSENSALISRIGENEDPIRVQFDMLRVVPNCISDEPIDPRTARGKRGRKPAKVEVCCTKVPYFSGATTMSPLEKGRLLFLCGNGCFEGSTMKETRFSLRRVLKLWKDDYSLKQGRLKRVDSFTNHVGAGVPKQAYEAARKTVSVMLPILLDARKLTSRTMSTLGEGVWVKRGLSVKRRCGRETPC